METSALKRPQEQSSSLTSKELLPHIHANRQTVAPCPPLLHHPLSLIREPGRGTLICRISADFDFTFETRVSLDFAMRYKIPHSTGIRQTTPDTLQKNAPELVKEINRISTSLLNQNPKRHLLSMGTLGGKKDFIEIAHCKNRYYLIVHSDARSLGHEVKKACQSRLEEHMKTAPATLHSLREILKDMERDLLAVRTFGRWNRQLIAREILGDLCEEMTDTLQEKGEMPPTQSLTSLYRFQVP